MHTLTPIKMIGKNVQTPNEKRIKQLAWLAVHCIRL